MKLTCTSRYRAGSVEYLPGQVLDLPDPEARYLLTASPGSFEIVVDNPEPDPDALFEAPEAPPADKMIRGRGRPKGSA